MDPTVQAHPTQPQPQGASVIQLNSMTTPLTIFNNSNNSSYNIISNNKYFNINTSLVMTHMMKMKMMEGILPCHPLQPIPPSGPNLPDHPMSG